MDGYRELARELNTSANSALLTTAITHLAMVAVGLVLGVKRMPVVVVVPTEFIPASMLAWSMPRSYYTFRRLRKVSEALDSAHKEGKAVPSWASQTDWRYRAVEGSDWEIAIAAGIALLLVWSLSGH